MSFSNYLEAAVLDKTMRNVNYAASAVYIKLHIGDPGEDCTSNPAVHTTRVLSTWAPPSGGSITTDAAVSFTPMAAAELITHVSVWDALIGGNPLMYGPLLIPVSVAANDTLVFPPGDIDVTLD